MTRANPNIKPKINGAFIKNGGKNIVANTDTHIDKNIEQFNFSNVNRLLNEHIIERKKLNKELREMRKEKYNLTLKINRELKVKRDRLDNVVMWIMKEAEELVKICQSKLK